MMSVVLAFLVCSNFYIVPSFGENDSLLEEDNHCKCESNGNVQSFGTAACNTYVLYIMGSIMILILIAIICLAILLYKSKEKMYKYQTAQNIPNIRINAETQPRYTTQTSQEITTLTINSLQEMNTKTKHNCSTETDTTKKDSLAHSSYSLNTIGDMNKEPGNEIKLYKNIKTQNDHQLLLKEQMKKICEDALAKSQNCAAATSITDVNSLLNESDDKKTIYVSEYLGDKSASFPQLDIYDTVPSKSIPVNDYDGDIPVYDCVPKSKKTVIKDNETMYLLPLSGDNLEEPCYINANFRLK